MFISPVIGDLLFDGYFDSVKPLPTRKPVVSMTTGFPVLQYRMGA